MRIQHNIMAMNAYRNYNTNTSALSKNLEKLSSGYKINRAGDDAAGLAISEKMRAQITGLNAAQKNVKDGISLVKTAEGAMQEIQDMLNRMDYLATQSANGTYDNEVDRANLQKEVDALKEEINRIADSANFNGIKLLDGKTGFNTKAIEIADEVTGIKPEKAVVGTITGANFVSGAFVTDPVGSIHGVHTNASASQQNPTFTINLSGTELKIGKKTGATASAKVTVKIGSLATITATINGANGADATKSASDIIDAIIAKFNSAVKAPGSSNKTLGSIAGLAFKASKQGSSINFVFKGKITGSEAAGSTAKFTASDVRAFNGAILGADLDVTASGSTATFTAHNVHGITNRTEAKVGTDNTPAGITLDVSQIIDDLSDGSEFIIDGRTFRVKTKASDSAVAADATSVIDLTTVASASAAAKAQKFVTEITKTANATTSHFNITALTGGTKLHIDQKEVETGPSPAASNVFKTVDSLKAVFSYKKITPAVTEVKAHTDITIIGSKLNEGDKIVVKKGSTETAYTFVREKATGSAGANQIEIGKNGSKAFDNFKAALQNARFTVASSSKANTIKVNGSKASWKDSDVAFAGQGGLTLQIGDTADSFNQLLVKTGDLHTKALGLDDMSVANPYSAAAAIETIRSAINQVSSIRGDLGATQNRLEHTANNLSVMAENIQDAEATIRDTDVAEEMMAYTKNNILVQSAQAMLAQANAVPQGVLQLLG